MNNSLRLIRLVAALSFAPLLGTAPARAADAPPTLAVVKLEADAAGASIATAFTESLTSELGGLRRFRMVERAQIAKVMQEQALGDAGVVDEASAARMGELLGAQKLVVGRLSRLDNLWQVDLRLIDSTSGSVDTTASTQCNLPGQLALCTRQLAGRLAGVAALIADSKEIKRVAYDLAATLVRQMPPVRVRISAASPSGAVQAALTPGNKAFARQRLALHPDPQERPGEPSRGICVVTVADPGSASALCEQALRPQRGEELRSLPLAVTVTGGSPELAEAVARQLVGKVGFAPPGTAAATAMTLTLEVGDGGMGQRRVVANLTASDDAAIVFAAESVPRL